MASLWPYGVGMTKKDMQRFVDFCGGRASACHALGGIDSSTLARWLNGQRKIGPVVVRLVKLIESQSI
jgi:hypothetical protein